MHSYFLVILVAASLIPRGDCTCQIPIEMHFVFWQCYEGRGPLNMEEGYITKEVFAQMVHDICRKSQKGLNCLRDPNTNWGCAAADKYLMLDALSVQAGLCSGPEISEETRLLINNFNNDIYIPDFEQMIFDLAFECLASDVTPFSGSTVKEFQKSLQRSTRQYRCMAQKSDEMGYPKEMKYVFYADAFGGELAGLVSPSSVGLLTSTDTNSIQ